MFASVTLTSPTFISAPVAGINCMTPMPINPPERTTVEFPASGVELSEHVIGDRSSERPAGFGK
jgi:hypothetical protein